MRSVLQTTIAWAILLTFTLPLQAQSNAGRRGGASGVGTGGVVSTTPPAVVRPPFVDSGPLLFRDMAEPSETTAPEQEKAPNDGERETTGIAPPEESPPEDPRTTITRDRIESPQH